MTTTADPSPATALSLAITPRRGRRYALEDPDVQATILQAILACNYIRTACRLAGISPATFYSYRRRVELGEIVPENLREFFLCVQQCDALAELHALKCLRAGGPDWRVWAWILEKRWPQRWGRPGSARRKRAKMLEARLDRELGTMSDAELDRLAAELDAR